MGIHWLSKLFSFSADASSESLSRTSRQQAADAPLQGTQSNQKSIPASQFRQYSSELDITFFAWLFDCDEDLFRDQPPIDETLLEAASNVLKTHVMKVEHLPRRPASLPMLIKLLRNDELPFSEISGILLTDPALTARILKTANSPYFRLSHEPVEQIDQAVAMLGLGGIRSVVSTMVMKPLMDKQSPEEQDFSDKAWRWGQLCAHATDQYAQTQGQPPGALHLLGLLPSLAFLLIYRGLRFAAKDTGQAALSEPLVARAMFKKAVWPVCRTLRSQWNLPEDSDKYLQTTRVIRDAGDYTPIRDGMVLASHQLLEWHTCSPLDDEQIFALTSAPSAVDIKVLQYLRRAADAEQKTH